MAESITIEKCPSLRTSCTKCSYAISQRSLHISTHHSFGNQYFHLRCYKPYNHKPLDFEADITLINVTSDKEIAQVKKWVEKWNAILKSEVSKGLDKFLTKEVQTNSTPARRWLLEVFAFLTDTEVEVLAARTCKEWFHVTRDEELWKRKYLQEFNPSETEAEASYREKFVALRANSCWSCNKFIIYGDVYMRCPFHRNRPMCHDCHTKPECVCMPVSRFAVHRHMAKSLFDDLHIPIFKLDGEEFVYASDIQRTITPYAQKRLELLIEYLEANHMSEMPAEFLEQLKQFDVVTLYPCDFYKHYGTFEKMLAKFCGRNERTENFQKEAKLYVGGVRELWRNIK